MIACIHQYSETHRYNSYHIIVIVVTSNRRVIGNIVLYTSLIFPIILQRSEPSPVYGHLIQPHVLLPQIVTKYIQLKIVYNKYTICCCKKMILVSFFFLLKWIFDQLLALSWGSLTVKTYVPYSLSMEKCLIISCLKYLYVNNKLVDITKWVDKLLLVINSSSNHRNPLGIPY